MNEAMYIAASGMSAVQRMLDSSTHNTVNANTPGYQNHLMMMKSFGAYLEDAGPRAELVGSQEIIRFEQGDLRPTDEPFAIGLMGDGFLAVRGDQDETFYTRNGDLTLNSEGQIITRAGYLVQGEGDEGIVIDPLGGEVTFGKDGMVLQNGDEIGLLRLVEFKPEDRDRMEAVAETLFRGPEGTKPQPSETTTVHHGFLEYSRHGGVKGMVDMIVANKNYEAMQRAIRSMDQLNESMIRQIQ